MFLHKIFQNTNAHMQEDVSKLRRGIVEEEGICHLSIRRMQAWKDYVSYFKKSWNKHKTHYPVSVSFLGEAAVDTGGPKREFFSGKFFVEQTFFNLIWLYAILKSTTINYEFCLCWIIFADMLPDYASEYWFQISVQQFQLHCCTKPCFI